MISPAIFYFIFYTGIPNREFTISGIDATHRYLRVDPFTESFCSYMGKFRSAGVYKDNISILPWYLGRIRKKISIPFAPLGITIATSCARHPSHLRRILLLRSKEKKTQMSDCLPTAWILDVGVFLLSFWVMPCTYHRKLSALIPLCKRALMSLSDHTRDSVMTGLALSGRTRCLDAHFIHQQDTANSLDSIERCASFASVFSGRYPALPTKV